MTPGRLSKVLSRRLTIAWREQPTQADIEAVEANIERVGLVIRVRWAIVAALAVFSVLGAAIYASYGVMGPMWRHMLVPSVALLLVLVYNTYYQTHYRTLGNYVPFNVGQLLADIAVVTVLLYYSGGVDSWFDSMYLLFVLEAAIILPTRRGVWAIAAAAMAAYVSVLALDGTGVLPHVAMPFVSGSLHSHAPFVTVRALWGLTVLAGTASIGTMLMREVRRREERLVAHSVRDAMTGLLNRGQLRAELSREINRSGRFGGGVSLILLDVDGFERFNSTFGHEAGNRMLCRVGEALTATVGDDDATDLALVARFGGEEFAILVPEEEPGCCEAGRALAEAVRSAVEAARDEDRSVTVSAGVSCFPVDGRNSAEMVGAADAALARAAGAGGNTVVTAREHPASGKAGA